MVRLLIRWRSLTKRGYSTRVLRPLSRQVSGGKLIELKCLLSIQCAKMLSRIVYYSRNLSRSRRAGREGSLTDILRVSRSSNAAIRGNQAVDFTIGR